MLFEVTGVTAGLTVVKSMRRFLAAEVVTLLTITGGIKVVTIDGGCGVSLGDDDDGDCVVVGGINGTSVVPINNWVSVIFPRLFSLGPGLACSRLKCVADIANANNAMDTATANAAARYSKERRQVIVTVVAALVTRSTQSVCYYHCLCGTDAQ